MFLLQWGWDSLHPQIKLESSVLSAFYEENPPGDESWEYTLRHGRSCETGWFWSGWTFVGEFWFHWAFLSVKVNIIKSGLTWIISVCIGRTTIKLTFLMQNKRLGAGELGCVYFHTVFAYISCSMNAVRQASLAKQTVVRFNLITIWSTFRKHSRATRAAVHLGFWGIEDWKLDSSDCAVNFHYELLLCFQQRFMVWAVIAYWRHVTFPTLAYLHCTGLILNGQCSTWGVRECQCSAAQLPVDG